MFFISRRKNIREVVLNLSAQLEGGNWIFSSDEGNLAKIKLLIFFFSENYHHQKVIPIFFLQKGHERLISEDEEMMRTLEF